MSTETIVEQINSDYFGEEDVMAMQARLIKKGIIDPEDGPKEPLNSPIFFAKALDHLVNQLIAEISEYPEEMLFGVCNGNYSNEFQEAIQAIRTRR